MLPAGAPTETTIEALARHAEPGDMIIDGGNSSTRTTSAARSRCAKKGIDYVDVGTSGGVWGLERGFCMMIGGREEIVRRLDPIFDALAPGLGDIARTPGGIAVTIAPNAAISMPARRARAISSRWSTTASSMA